MSTGWPIHRGERSLIKGLLKVARAALAEVVCLMNTRECNDAVKQQVASLHSAIDAIDRIVL